MPRRSWQAKYENKISSIIYIPLVFNLSDFLDVEFYYS